ncbi:MAG TPA: hypothetical protein VMW86_07865, partial [Dehalococcoidales bacterium]|nr:hypothetical protein [Dehalococcoidales bacterium]
MNRVVINFIVYICLIVLFTGIAVVFSGCESIDDIKNKANEWIENIDQTTENVADNDESKPQTSIESAKDITDCKYKITWSTNILYTNSYDKITVGDNDIITVHGFLERFNNNWVWRSSDIELDEKYFGQIEIVQQIIKDGYLVESFLVPPKGIIGDWKQME